MMHLIKTGAEGRRWQDDPKHFLARLPSLRYDGIEARKIPHPSREKYRDG